MLTNVMADDAVQARGLVQAYARVPVRGDVTHPAPPPSVARAIEACREQWNGATPLVQALAIALIEADPDSLGAAALNGVPLPRGHADRDDVVSILASEVAWHALPDDLDQDFALLAGEDAERARMESLATEVGAAADGVLGKLTRLGFDTSGIGVEDVVATVVFVDDQHAAHAARRVTAALYVGRRTPLALGLAQAVAAWTQRGVWGALAPDELRDLRKKAGLTQAQLAAAVGKGLRTVVSWEQGRGRIDPETAARIRAACATRTVAAIAAAEAVRDSHCDTSS